MASRAPISLLLRPAEPGSAGTDFGAAGRPTQAPKLNLSHIECVDGAVEIHFVLLFVPDGATTTNVQAGDVLAQPAGAGDISHVTYCGCPV